MFQLFLFLLWAPYNAHFMCEFYALVECMRGTVLSNICLFVSEVQEKKVHDIACQLLVRPTACNKQDWLDE